GRIVWGVLLRLGTGGGGLRPRWKSKPATDSGKDPAPTVEVVGKAPAPSPKRIVTVLELSGVPRLATARSSLPSPLKSPTATDTGKDPAKTGERAGWVKPPRLSPSRIVTLLEKSLATAR